MNNSLAVFLISDEARALTYSYDKDVEGKGINTSPAKTLDPDLKVGDFVVVPTTSRHRMTVVRVESIDDEIDFDNDRNYPWVIDRVNDEHHKETLAKEGAALSAITAARKKKKRQELKEMLLEDTDDAVKALPIYTAKD